MERLAKTLAIILNGQVSKRIDQQSPIRLSIPISANDLSRSRSFGLSVVNFGGGEAEGKLHLSFPSNDRSISVTQVNQAYVNRVVPLTGAETAKAQQAFDAIELGAFKGVQYSSERINGSNDETNCLIPGSIYLCKTAGGNFCKFMVRAYGYDLALEWVTYSPEGAIISRGDNLTVRGTYTCDLDQGRESGPDSSFWWEQMDDTQRYIIPGRGASFARLDRSQWKVRIP